MQLLVRHSELEQAETKAQAALVTILSLTQITELKLLLDIGRQGHRFYDFVLTLLVACISLEICVGVIIIYIGNLHYYQVYALQIASVCQGLQTDTARLTYLGRVCTVLAGPPQFFCTVKTDDLFSRYFSAL